MQRADVVLSILRDKSRKNKNFIFDRIYRHLYNKDFYTGIILGEIKNSCNGNEQKVQTANNLEKQFISKEKEAVLPLCMVYESIDEVISLVKLEKFYPHKTILGSNLVRNAMISMIDSIFLLDETESNYYKKVHKSLFSIKNRFKDTNWIIKGKFKDFSSKEFMRVYLEIICSRIKDGRFIELLSRYISISSKYIDEKMINVLVKCMDRYLEYKFDYYSRVKDEFLIGIKKDKNEAKKLFNYIQTNLSYINIEETNLYNFKDKKIPFAGFKIGKGKNNEILFWTTREQLDELIRHYSVNGKPISNSKLVNYPLREIIRIYNNEFIKFREYNLLAVNFKQAVRKFRYIQYFSLLKTIASKEKISVKMVIKKYGCRIKMHNCDKTRIVIAIDGCIYAGFNT